MAQHRRGHPCLCSLYLCLGSCLAYLDPELASLTWCPPQLVRPASLLGTCLAAWVILGTTTGPALLPCWGFVGLQPHTQPWCCQTKSVSEKPCCPSWDGECLVCVLGALEPLGSCCRACKVLAGWAACWGRGNCTARKREQYRWCFCPQN